MKKYRVFYDFDDKEVWASYDGCNIEILSKHCSNKETKNIELASKILKEDCDIIVATQHSDFTYKSVQPEIEFINYLNFNDDDPIAKNGKRYKIFHQRDYAILASKSPNRYISVIYFDWGVTVGDLMLKLLEQMVDFKQLARYDRFSEDGSLKIKFADFDEDFNIT